MQTHLQRSFLNIVRHLILPLCLLIAHNKYVNAQDLSANEQLNTDIKRSLHANEFIEIPFGETTFAVQKHDSYLPLNKGLVIFVPDADAGLGQTTSVMQLAKTLPQWGWTTVLLPSLDMTLAMEEGLDEDPSTTDTASEGAEDEQETTGNTPATDTSGNSELAQTDEPESKELHGKYDFGAFSDEAYTRYQEALLKQIAAIETQFSHVLGHRIIVSQGMSASVLMASLSTQTDLPINAIIVSNPYFPKYEKNQTVPTLVASTTVPTLDIVSPSDNRWSHATQDKRRISAQRMLKADYRQQATYGLSHHEQALDRLAKDIYGWTSSLGW